MRIRHCLQVRLGGYGKGATSVLFVDDLDYTPRTTKRRTRSSLERNPKQFGRGLLSFLLALLMVFFQSGMPPGSSAQTTSPPENGNPTQGAPQSQKELQALVAPIALYPDALVAQILTASTFPDQVAIANYWFGQNKNLTGNALMQAADKQSWDPSVKALTQFPSVLDNLAKNLAWTSSLGRGLPQSTGRCYDRDPSLSR